MTNEINGQIQSWLKKQKSDQCQNYLSLVFSCQSEQAVIGHHYFILNSQCKQALTKESLTGVLNSSIKVILVTLTLTTPAYPLNCR